MGRGAEKGTTGITAANAIRNQGTEKMTMIEKKPAPLFRVILCLLILAVGIGGFRILKNMKKPPKEKEVIEQTLPVEVITVQPVEFPVFIRGYGNVTSRTRVVLSAEVSGRITFKRDQLEAGRIVEQGEKLFVIDQEEYQLDLTTAESLLKILTRDHEIAMTEFTRIDTLYRTKKVGNQSAVEKAEAAVNSIANQLQQVRQNKERARIKLQRCVIFAPFTGRLSQVLVEQDEYVNPGQKMITLINDAELEVIVSLDSRDAASWLRLSTEKEQLDGNWFSRPQQVRCAVVWSENQEVQGTGFLDRIVRFDPKTRMLSVAVSLEQSKPSAFPLADGMFCRVTIPGKVLEQVYVVPRQAVSFTGSVYVVQNGRLQTRKVTVVREDEDTAVISDGLTPGDTVITTRLENPLSNSLIRIMATEGQ
jgi:RND family efflux transporter MFP subunit